MNGLKRCRDVLVVATSVLTLSGCPIPIPPLGYSSDSRTNLPDRVPEFIVKGVTTREAVLLGLGAPDSYSPDGRWFAYRSERHTGGIIFVVAAGAGAAGAGVMGYNERLLMVRFDATSVVTEATLEDRICPRGAAGIGSAGGESSPCLRIPDPAVAEALVEAETGLTAAIYDQAAWALGRVDPLIASDGEARHSGRILVTNRGVLAVADGDGRGRSPEASRYWLPYAQIARADTVRYPTGIVGTLSLRDGRTYSVAILRGTGLAKRIDGEATSGLVERVVRALADHREQP
jgi:hypothetical protein